MLYSRNRPLLLYTLSLGTFPFLIHAARPQDRQKSAGSNVLDLADEVSAGHGSQDPSLRTEQLFQKRVRPARKRVEKAVDQGQEHVDNVEMAENKIHDVFDLYDDHVHHFDDEMNRLEADVQDPISGISQLRINQFEKLEPDRMADFDKLLVDGPQGDAQAQIRDLRLKQEARWQKLRNGEMHKGVEAFGKKAPEAPQAHDEHVVIAPDWKGKLIAEIEKADSKGTAEKAYNIVKGLNENANDGSAAENADATKEEGDHEGSFLELHKLEHTLSSRAEPVADQKSGEQRQDPGDRHEIIHQAGELIPKEKQAEADRMFESLPGDKGARDPSHLRNVFGELDMQKYKKSMAATDKLEETGADIARNSADVTEKLVKSHEAMQDWHGAIRTNIKDLARMDRELTDLSKNIHIDLKDSNEDRLQSLDKIVSDKHLSKDEAGQDLKAFQSSASSADAEGAETAKQDA